MDAAGLLRTARTGEGLSQGELSRRAGCPASVISAIETGQREPSVALLLRLLRVMGRGLELRRERRPVETEHQGEQLREALRLASLLPHEGRRGKKLMFPRLPELHR
jgi:transcriptional regulator with XRE-family HTH domain